MLENCVPFYPAHWHYCCQLLYYLEQTNDDDYLSSIGSQLLVHQLLALGSPALGSPALGSWFISSWFTSSWLLVHQLLVHQLLVYQLLVHQLLAVGSPALGSPALGCWFTSSWFKLVVSVVCEATCGCGRPVLLRIHTTLCSRPVNTVHQHVCKFTVVVGNVQICLCLCV